MKGTMKAMRLHRVTPNISEGLQLDIVPIPQIGPYDVLVDVKATGLCGSDIHSIEGLSPRDRYPVTLGHETAGVICEVGSQVKGFQVGERVCVNFSESCGQCPLCRMGRSSICINPKRLGRSEEGAYAEYIKVAANTLVKLPDNIPFDQAAACTDAVATPFHAIDKHGQLKPGDSIAIFGLGGLGVSAILISKLYGAGLIIGIDVDNYICERAREFGADVVINSVDKDPVDAIRELTGGIGVDISMEIVGLPAVQEQSINCLRPGGKALMLGLGEKPVKLPSVGIFVRQEWQVIGSYAFETAEIEKIVKLVSMGKLNLSNLISSHISLEEVSKGLQDLHDKRGYPIRIVAMQE